MTINWWTLGLQAVNVLVLVWLLTRFFWRPVANAIATRQETVQTLLADAETTKSKAETVLAEIKATRSALAEERKVLLANATNEALAEVKTTMAKAAAKADAVLKAAQMRSRLDAEADRAIYLSNSAALAVTIARKLMERLSTLEIQSVFLDQLVKAIAQMTPKDRELFVANAGGIDLVSPNRLKAAEKEKMTKAIFSALGGKPVLNFVTDPALIAGFEMRTVHYVVRASWQSDLASISRDLENAT